MRKNFNQFILSTHDYNMVTSANQKVLRSANDYSMPANKHRYSYFSDRFIIFIALASEKLVKNYGLIAKTT